MDASKRMRMNKEDEEKRRDHHIIDVKAVAQQLRGSLTKRRSCVVIQIKCAKQNSDDKKIRNKIVMIDVSKREDSPWFIRIRKVICATRGYILNQ